MEPSILESIGVEIIGVMSPVSVCMFLVVLLIYSLSSSDAPFSAAPIRTAANLVYLESPSDSTATKLEGALINALVFVALITLVTFLLVLLYYYNFSNFLKNYMRFSAFFVLATMGGSIFLSIIQHFDIPVDALTCFLFLFNFTVVGVLSVFSAGFPIFIRQAYMVSLGVIVAAWFSRLPEWTTWVLLVALAVYDLVAVLAPGGPLKMLVELASSRDEDLPALVYEARPTANPRSSSWLLVGGVSDSGSVELQAVPRSRNAIENRDNPEYTSVQIGDFEGERGREDAESAPLVGNSSERVSSTDASSEHSMLNLPWGRNNGPENSVDEQRSPLVELLGMDNETPMFESRGIKLGLGDFVFYSVLVGRAAMYDLMTVYACYLAIISGLGCTLILLCLCHRALPALPISITLGILFYFLTRLLMEPFIVGTMTNLMMF